MTDYTKLGTGSGGHEFREFVDRIEDHLDDPDYSWASDTLEGILDNVVMHGRFTEAQEEAVSNIEAAIDRRRDL